MARPLPAIAVALVCACGDSPDEGQTSAFSPDSSGGVQADDGSGVGPGVDTTGGDAATEDDGPAPGDGSSGGPGDDTTTGPSYDCTPWPATWIGGPCASDADCSYDGGVCLREDQGFPCGTCTQSCEMLCPDLDGAPETFCVDGADVGLASAGQCLSKCDPGLLGGDGCRDGYGCAELPRFHELGTVEATCVPDPFVPPASDCASMLDAIGASWEPSDHVDESPEGYPDLVCHIEEPVILYEGVPGVPLRYVESDSPDGVLLGCRAALSVAHTSAVAAEMGAVEFVHYGTYNCRPIAGTSTLSQHAFANAIDIYGFTLEGGGFYTVLDDWEDFVAMPSTTAGTWLRDLTDALWDMGIWNIILTPEYNDAHDNHVHVDLTVDGHYYYWD